VESFVRNELATAKRMITPRLRLYLTLKLANIFFDAVQLS
jgi:hypothetical protein